MNLGIIVYRLDTNRVPMASKQKYPPLEIRSLPEAPPLRTAFGVGAVVLGLAIGSGELILWPHLVVTYGPGILWGALCGITMEYFINKEVARNALATGESFFTAAARVTRWTVPFWLVSVLLLYVWPGWSGAMGATLTALFGFGDPIYWAWASLVAVCALVLTGQVAYVVMERVVKAIVLVFFALLLVASFLNLTPEILMEALWGLTNFGQLPATIDLSTFFGAVVFAGAGGMLSLCVSLWYRDKQAGMGAYVERIKNPLTTRPQAVAAIGYTFPITAETLRRWKQWMRLVYIDQGIVFALFGLLGLLLVSLNAHAVLAPLGAAPEGILIIKEQARIFGNLWGVPGSTLFLTVVFLELFSTLWVVLDVCSRIVGDIVYTNSRVGPLITYFAWAKRFSAHTLYYALFTILIVINALLIPYGQPFFFLVTSAVLGGMVMAVYVPLLLYVNNYTLPKELRPSLVTNLVLGAAAVFYIFFSVLVCLRYIL